MSSTVANNNVRTVQHHTYPATECGVACPVLPLLSKDERKVEEKEISETQTQTQKDESPFQVINPHVWAGATS